jgi:3-dehydroquinate dehydratase-2
VGYRLFVLNGPNLNRLGRREPHIYGHVTLAEIEQRCQEVARELDFDLFFGQSNAESELIGWLHRADDEAAAVIINPAGFTYRSVAIHDALRALRQPTIEVHLTNIFGREPVYHQPLTSAAVSGLIAGLGAIGYELAMRGLAQRLADGPSAGP